MPGWRMPGGPVRCLPGTRRETCRPSRWLGFGTFLTNVQTGFLCRIQADQITKRPSNDLRDGSAIPWPFWSVTANPFAPNRRLPVLVPSRFQRFWNSVDFIGGRRGAPLGFGGQRRKQVAAQPQQIPTGALGIVLCVVQRRPLAVL